MELIDTLSSLASKVAISAGLELVDVEIFRAGKRRIVRIYIGKRGGISVEDCAKVSRDLGTLLDADNVMQDDNYVLEVSSPGLDRPFKTLADYKRNIGGLVRVSTSAPVEGKRLVVGLLEDVSDTTITILRDVKNKSSDKNKDTSKDKTKIQNQSCSIPISLIVQAKIDIRIS